MFVEFNVHSIVSLPGERTLACHLYTPLTLRFHVASLIRLGWNARARNR